MLRLRAQSGKTITMDEPLIYVEVLDEEDNVAMVFHREKIAGVNAVNLLTPDSESATSYAALYNVRWSNKLKTDWASETSLDFKKS